MSHHAYIHQTCFKYSTKRHTHYRPFLIDHLFDTTLRHWEFEMRVLGAQSLRAISELDLSKLGVGNAARAVWCICLSEDPELAEN